MGAGTRKSPPEGDRPLPQPSDKADRSQGNVAREPELGVSPGLTASSAAASELGGSSLHLLVVRCKAILILPTLFKSIPSDTTREQNALRPREGEPTGWACGQTQQGPSGEGEQAWPPFLHRLTASLKPRLRVSTRASNTQDPALRESPHCHAELGASTLRPRGPVPHGGEWGIKQDQRCARSTEGGSPQEGRGDSGG